MKQKLRILYDEMKDIVASSNISTLSLDSQIVKGILITAQIYNTLLKTAENSANYCNCNCNFYLEANACKCNYQIINCTCACNYCTCNCNWSCPCNCAY